MPCPANCSERGVCLHGKCHCAPGYLGANCSQVAECPNACSDQVRGRVRVNPDPDPDPDPNPIPNLNPNPNQLDSVISTRLIYTGSAAEGPASFYTKGGQVVFP